MNIQRYLDCIRSIFQYMPKLHCDYSCLHYFFTVMLTFGTSPSLTVNEGLGSISIPVTILSGKPSFDIYLIFNIDFLSATHAGSHSFMITEVGMLVAWVTGTQQKPAWFLGYVNDIIMGMQVPSIQWSLAHIKLFACPRRLQRLYCP